LLKLPDIRKKPFNAAKNVPFRVVNSLEGTRNLRSQPYIAAQKREFSTVTTISNWFNQKLLYLRAGLL
jgi:hypothetical protein